MALLLLNIASGEMEELKWDHLRLLIEACLVLVSLALLFRKSFKPEQQELTKQVIELRNGCRSKITLFPLQSVPLTMKFSTTRKSTSSARNGSRKGFIRGWTLLDKGRSQ